MFVSGTVAGVFIRLYDRRGRTTTSGIAILFQREARSHQTGLSPCPLIRLERSLVLQRIARTVTGASVLQLGRGDRERNATAHARRDSARADIDRNTAIFLLAITVVVAAALRLIGANDQLWFDEIATLLDSVRKPLGVIATHFPSDNDHVFYSELAHISVRLGGETPFTVRLPAILFGIASIPLIYWVGTKITTRIEALASAILATVAAYHIWFSQNARGYTILLVLSLVGTRLILNGLRARSIKPWLGFALVSALAAYTHLSMIMMVVGQAIAVALYLLTSKRATMAEMKGPAIGFIGAALLTIILYLPMLGDVATFFHGEATAAKPTATSGLLHMFSEMQVGLARGTVAILGAAVFLIGLVSYWRQSSLIPGLFFIPPALIYLTTVLLERPTRPRFFFFIAGFLLLVGVRGVFVIIHFLLDRMGRPLPSYEKPVRWLAVAAMAGVLVADLSRTYGKPKMDYEGALAFVDGSRLSDNAITLAGVGADFVYSQYYHRNWPELKSTDQLASLRRGRDVLVLHTLARSFRQTNPSLFEALKSSCREERIFAGTLQDGDIIVSRCARQQ